MKFNPLSWFGTNQQDQQDKLDLMKNYNLTEFTYQMIAEYAKRNNLTIEQAMSIQNRTLDV